MSWLVNPVKLLHVELSSYCNAACPFCPRYYSSTDIVREELVTESISFDNFKKYFPDSFLQQLQRLMFCGTMGDPVMARDVAAICQHCVDVNPTLNLVVHTNGGMRNREFWQEFGEIFQNANTQVIWSIDGLENTNHLYRRNVVWSKLMENVQAFIAAGGRAVWEFLVFQHNEHEIAAAQQLSQRLGFVEFRIKRAFGFEDYQNQRLISKPVYDNSGQLQYKIAAPNNQQYRNNQTLESIDIEYNNINVADLKSPRKFVPTVESMGNYRLMLENKTISCNSLQNNISEIYVNSQGIVFPCCFVGTRFDGAVPSYVDLQLKSAIAGQLNNLDLNLNNIDAIISSGVLDRLFTDSWSQRSIAEGKMAICAETCGQNSSLNNLYFQNS